MKVVVIGGRGFFGSSLVAALARNPPFVVHSAGRSRRGVDVQVDVSDPDTLGALSGYDVVINASDSLAAPPDLAIEQCLARGQTFVECSAEASTVERLLLAYARRGDLRGRLLLGAGLFPGLSNVLAMSAIPPDVKLRSLECAVRSSPLSGGGQGMCRLMVSALVDNVVAFEDGQRVELAPGGRGPHMHFAGRERRTLRVPFAEAAMLRQSARAANIATYFSPKPSVLLFAMRALARLSVLRLRVAEKVMLAFLVWLRGALLRRIPTAVTLTAVANRLGRRHPQGQFQSVHVSDGIEAGARAVVALVEALARVPERVGLVLPEELVALDELLLRMRELGGEELRIERHHDSRAALTGAPLRHASPVS